jgi:hypothetical protein
MPVPDQVRDDGSGIQCRAWIPGPALDPDPGFAGMTTLRYLIAGVIRRLLNISARD